jgi:hypothetical protein
MKGKIYCGVHSFHYIFCIYFYCYISGRILFVYIHCLEFLNDTLFTKRHSSIIP